jgi:hypothetical protein
LQSKVGVVMSGGVLSDAWRGLRLLWRALCYMAFFAAAWAFWTMQRLMDSGLCSRIDTGSVTCVAPDIRRTAETALSVVLFGGFTFLPALMALLGCVFLIRDLWRVFRRLRLKRGSAT